MERDKRLITSVSEEEKQAIRMAAARQGITMSELVRNAVLDNVAVKIERETKNPTRAETINAESAISTNSD